MMLARSGMSFSIVDINSLEGGTRTPEFLALNPDGKVPFLTLDNGRALGESNAIMLYLAEGGELLPKDSWQRAKVYQWLFWEQYTHEPAIAVRRAFLFYESKRGLASERRLEMLLKNGEQALSFMDARLQQSEWLAGDSPTVADLSLYAYTHMAEQGGFSLSKYPAVCQWLTSVEKLPGHVNIDWRP